MACAAAAVVSIHVIGVVGRATFIRAIPVIALILGRRALHFGAVFKRTNLRSVLFVDFILARIALRQDSLSLFVAVGVLGLFG